MIKLQTKFTLTHLIITTIPMLLVFLFFRGQIYNMVLADTLRKEQASSSATLPQVEALLDEITQAGRTLTGLPLWRSLTTGEPEETSPGENLVSDFQSKAQALTESGLITRIRLYLPLSPDNPLFAQDQEDMFAPISEAQGTYWHGIFQGDRSLKALFCPSFYLSPRELSSCGDMAYVIPFSVSRGEDRLACYGVLYFSKAPFQQLLTDNQTTAEGVTYILNERDSTVATSDEAKAGIYHFAYDDVKSFFLSSNSFILKSVLGEQVYAGFYHIAATNWFLIAVIPARVIAGKSLTIILLFLLVYALCVAVAFLLATTLSRSITNRLSSVVYRMAQVRTGPPIPLDESGPRDEIGQLIDTYNYMTRAMNELIDQQKKASEDLRLAEFKSLQAQINPHFLYNTLDMISWLSREGRSREVSDAVLNLSRFYKLTLSRREMVTTLADEVEHVEIYVRLQNMRYHDAITLDVDIPDYLMECAIPKLTLQPVVENAILHGLLEKKPVGGNILLTGWQSQDEVILLVSDDGVGIPPHKLPSILSGDREDTPAHASSEGGAHRTGTNIAVYNTHRRLQLLYGDAFGLSYASTPGKGTEVEIRLPSLLPSPDAV